MSLRAIPLAELKRAVGAGRRRAGLFNLMDGEGGQERGTVPLSYCGEQVTVVSLWADGRVAFYGGDGGWKKLVEFAGDRGPDWVPDPYLVDAGLPPAATS